MGTGEIDFGKCLNEDVQLKESHIQVINVAAHACVNTATPLLDYAHVNSDDNASNRSPVLESVIRGASGARKCDQAHVSNSAKPIRWLILPIFWRRPWLRLGASIPFFIIG